MQKTEPVRIAKLSDTQMKITWNSGEDSIFEFRELRFQCRCAECVDEWTRKKRISREQIRADVRPSKLNPVGRYALQIDWTDGHRTGIYPYELLWQLAHADPISKKDEE